MKFIYSSVLSGFVLFAAGCTNEDSPNNNENGKNDKVWNTTDQFVMGADLSYVNQILDHNGVYRDSGIIAEPYKIFKDYGANVIRFRLFHTPAWTKELYGESGTQMYNDYYDVKLGIEHAKSQGMKVLLDFHYSDTWADPGKQYIPAAWESISLEVLLDSVYEYTYSVLDKLNKAGLMPEYVQIGNEINPGLLLPLGDRWSKTDDMVSLLNAGIEAVKNVTHYEGIQPEIMIHIAQPENALTWFEGLQSKGLIDFDIIGFSYYSKWSEVNIENISNYISVMKKDFGKDVMILETAYPWTTEFADGYPNIFGPNDSESDYPATQEGQYRYLVKLTQEIIDGGGKGIFYWEPAWITSHVKTQWGQGSAWENNALFDFNGNPVSGMNFMTYPYDFE
jgi:arabinogalactan endo-1,4-beta-galactosidase